MMQSTTVHMAQATVISQQSLHLFSEILAYYLLNTTHYLLYAVFFCLK